MTLHLYGTNINQVSTNEDQRRWMMFKTAFVLVLLMGFQVAHANKLQPNYFKGQQPIGIAGDTVECLVEATFGTRNDRVKIRSLVADSHDKDKTVGYGPVVATYDAKSLGYVFVTKKANKDLQALILSAPERRTAQGLSLEISHGNHTDTVACNNLNLLYGSELALATEKFEHFEDYVEDGGHDHGHQHGHKHKHR